MDRIATANEEAIEAWNGVLFDRWVQFREAIVNGLSGFSDEALRVCPPNPGDRVIDLGCGLGETTLQIARLIGPEGEVVGVDSGDRFVQMASEEAEREGVANARFEVADIQAGELGGPYDYAFGRFGTMFFANPVAAMRNVREALKPGAPLCMVVWRQKVDNEWLYRAEQVVEQWVEEDEDSDELTCGPGPFSMANADVTSGVLLGAGFENVSLRRCDVDFRFGGTLADGVALVMAIGPAGEVLRLAGDQAKELRPQIEAALTEELAVYQTDDGVRAPASTWIVTATAPQA